MAVNPITLLNGTTAYASDVETKVNPLYTSIDNSNISASAGIVFSKLDSTTVAGVTATQTLTNKSLTSAIVLTALNFHSSADLRVYSDAGTTLVYQVDGATGDFGIAAARKFYLDGAGLNGDTYIYESVANQMTFFVNGGNRIDITSTKITCGIDVSLPATNKLYLDGGTNTYIYESAGDQITFVCGGSNRVDISTTRLICGVDFSVPSTNKIYLDGGTDTYIYESSANQISFFTNGTNKMNLSASTLALTSNTDLSLEPTKKLYLDGGTDTYIHESAANVISLFCGATNSASLRADSFALPAAAKIFLDGVAASGGTYVQEISDGEVVIFCNGTEHFRVSNGSGMLLPAIDPPNANYANRNSFVKAWINSTSAGVANDSYNCSVVKNSTGNYTVTFNTDFANANYSAVATISAGGAVASYIRTSSPLVGSIVVETFDATPAASDRAFCLIAIGDQ